MSTSRVVVVVGAGQMGTGIALTTAMRLRCPVTLADLATEQLQKSEAFIETYLDKQHRQKQKLTKEDVTEISKLIQYHELNKCDEQVATSQIIIEAIKEDLVAKQSLLSTLGNIKLASSKFTEENHWWIASNTSSLSITELAMAFDKHKMIRERFLGLHFMNPVPVMPIVELIPSPLTTQEVQRQARMFAEALGKTVIGVQDRPGFVSNRLLMPYINEAFYVLEERLIILPPEGVGVNKEGVNEQMMTMAKEVDTLIKGTTNNPMGPLELADFIGLDTCLMIMQTLHRGLDDDKYRPCPLMQRLVQAGRLGRKMGQGVYTYTNIGSIAINGK